MADNLLTQFANIQLVALDVDGVLTDSKLFILPNGEAVRGFHIKDGYAIQLANRHGLEVVIISGSGDGAVHSRFEKLGVKEIHLNIKDKKTKLSEILHARGIHPQNVLYMGDDMPDLLVMDWVGLSACPTDAATEVRLAANYISPIKGGEGCVREVIEKILKLQDKWIPDSQIASR
jgi:3-deoxy-D-manno-octulosonate 8-phosphate phosphatase (KDO 8-P phosphatase)